MRWTTVKKMGCTGHDAVTVDINGFRKHSSPHADCRAHFDSASQEVKHFMMFTR